MDSKNWAILGLFAVMVVINAPVFARDAGPLGWWELDGGSGETAMDSSGCGNRGALENGPSWVTGRVGGALNFNNTDSTRIYVEIPKSPTLENMQEGDCTVAAWVKPDALPPGTGITPAYGIVVKTGHHIGLAYDSVAREFGATTWKLNIAGPEYGNYREAMNGKIDDAGIYNRALSASEIAAPASRITSVPSPATPTTRPVAKQSESNRKNQWVNEHLMNEKSKPLFSFVYDGQASESLLAGWQKKVEKTQLDAERTQHTLSWTDPKSGLQVRCVAVDYADYPAVEWTVYLSNTSTVNTPVLKDIQGVNARFDRAGDSEFLLHGIKGDSCTADSYQPYQIELGPNAVERFAPPASGKSCDGPRGWPYFNLQMPGGGVILAVGWPGQWAASFSRDGSNGVRIVAGQELTHLFLKPGEQIRTPLIALLFWRGNDMVSAQNLWRRWYIAHNLPRTNGKPQPPVLQIQVDGSEQTIAYVGTFLQAGIRPDVCWRDAGAGGTTWYPSDTNPYQGRDAWLNTGTWEIDRTKYPHGFKPFSDWAHSNGLAFLLWFEPERVGDPDSWLGRDHPEWLLPGTSHGALLNEGNAEALNWLSNHVDGIIKSQGLDWYREDMNGGGPLPAWRKHDAQDRQGITENLYVQGHLAYWDELKRRNPGLRIDSCASGGRRNDLETMRRAVPLLRSDFQFPDMPRVVEGNQGHTYGLSFWLPFQGSGVYAYDAYSFRSFYMASFGMGVLTPENTAAQQQAYAECRRFAPLMLADYYPLTAYSLELDRWIAWQFNRAEEGDGMIQAFRRDNCETSAQTFRLRRLDPAAQYEVTNFDAECLIRMSGKDLVEKGLAVEIQDKPGSALIGYKKAP